MDLPERCRLLLEQIADRVPPDVLAEARSYGAAGEWEAALIATGNADVEVSPQEQDRRNDLLAQLSQPPEDVPAQYLERRREFLVHPSHYQYYVRDYDCDYDPMIAPLEEDGLISVRAARHLVHVRTGMYGFDLPLTVEVLDTEPEVGLAGWQEVSEATAALTGQVLIIESILSPRPAERLPLPARPNETRSYRVRVHATGRAEAFKASAIVAEDGDPLIERHLIQLWPAPPGPFRTWKP
jgi:hypothetical protein